MTDKEVLRKAIYMARDNGLKPYLINYDCELFDDFENWWCKNSVSNRYYKLIFNHNFSKTFWGEGMGVEVNLKRLDVGQHITESIHDWKYHLQQIILEPNPIDYLRKFIDNAEKP